MCAWIIADARERGRKPCYDFDTFLFFAWPVLAPIYLFQTRGARGIVPIVIFGTIITAAYAGAYVVAHLRY